MKTPKHSEVADRQLEADLGIEVTGIKNGNKSCSNKKREREKATAVGKQSWDHLCDSHPPVQFPQTFR